MKASTLALVVAGVCLFSPHRVVAGPDPSAVKLQADVSAAIAQHQPTITVPAGVYVFGEAPLNISNAKDMVFNVEAPVTLWFSIPVAPPVDPSPLRALGGGVRFQSCSNVTWNGNGMVIDYDPLPYLQFTAVSEAVPSSTGVKDQYSILVSPDAGSPEVYGFWNLYQPGGLTPDEYPRGPLWWDASQGNAFPPLVSSGGRDSRTFDPTTDLVKTKTPDVYNFTSTSATPPKKGDKFTEVIRIGFTWLIRQSDHVTSRNVSIYSAPFMSITEFDGKGSNVYDGMKVVRRPAASSSDSTCGPNKDRVCLGLMAANADLFHSSGCQKGPVLRNSELGYADDDYFNVHTRVQLSAGVDDAASKRFLVLDPRLGTDARDPDNYPYGTVETFPNVRPGMKLSFHHMDVLTVIASVTVDTVSRVPATDPAVATAESVCTNINTLTNHPKPQFRNISVTGADTSPRVWWMTIKEPLSTLPGVVKSNVTLLTVDDWRNDGAVLENNFFHGGVDGVRWKSSNGIIRSNKWLNALSNPNTGLEVTPLRCYLEGPLLIDNVLITENEFQGVPDGPSGGLIRVCHGIGQQADPVFQSCSNITVVKNSWPQ